MKNFTLRIALLLFIGLGFSQANAQVTNDQWTVITKKTADWCTNCGSWGWTAFEDIIDDMDGKKAIMLAMHQSNSGLTNATSTAIVNNFVGNSQPMFFLNNDNQQLLNGNQAAKRTEIIEQVDLLESLAGVSGVEIIASTEGTKLFVTANVEFFGALTNEFSLGIYIVQNNVVAFQATKGSVAHPKLLTGRMTADAFGDILDPAIATHTMTYEVDVPADFDVAETEIVGVIWLKDTNGVYRFNNANIDTEIDLILSNDNLDELVSSFKAQITNDQLTVALELVKNVDNASLLLTDLSGKTILSNQLGAMPVGSKTLNHDLATLPSGMYIVSLEIEGKRVSKKLFK